MDKAAVVVARFWLGNIKLWEKAMSILSSVWKIRNEPVMFVLSLAIIVCTVITSALIINQHLIRGEALVCGGQWFPRQGNCDPEGYVPVGTVMAFFGLDNQIPSGWEVCNGQTITEDMAWDIDANPDRPGVQLPDLRNMFIRGSQDELESSSLSRGGQEFVESIHSHQWARVQAHRWYTYDESNNEVRVDDWVGGLGDEGEDEFPLKARDDWGTKSMYTDEQIQEIPTLPPYTELRYIIKIG